MWFSKKKSESSHTLRLNVGIRMEAIGGQGANSAGKILAEAAVLGMGYTGNHFSSFGSEKRGSPVRSFVRFSTERKPVRTASNIQNPDVLVVFHESLLTTHLEVLAGVSENTDILVNSSRRPDEISIPVNLIYNRISVVDASALAAKNKCGINAVLMGAISKLIPEIKGEVLMQVYQNFFRNLSALALENNLNGYRFGADRVKTLEYRQPKDDELKENIDSKRKPMPVMGYLNAPIGGIVVNPGNTALKNNSASRKGVAPKFFKEICFNCGYCDMVCPDFCFVWKKDLAPGAPPELLGIDYQYCKGCQKCIVACPVQALVPVSEDKIPESERQQKVFPEARVHVDDESWIKGDWPKYVEELSDEARMMTLQTELLDPKTYIRPEFPEFSDLKKSRKK